MALLSVCSPAGQRTSQSARLPGPMKPAVIDRGATCKYTPSLASKPTSQVGMVGAMMPSTAAKMRRHRYHRLAAIVILGIVMPFTSTSLPCTPAVAPSPHTCSSQSAAVPPAVWQSLSACTATLVSAIMSK